MISQDEIWDDYFAASDALRERYAAERKDLQMYEQSEREYYEYMHTVQEAGYGTDSDAYENNWKRAINYYKQLGY